MMARQLSVRAYDDDGTLLPGRTQLDAAGWRLDNGAFGALETKLSPHAPLTQGQLLHFPALARNGGIVVGKNGRSIGMPAGFIVPPTKVQVIRGPGLPNPESWWSNFYE